MEVGCHGWRAALACAAASCLFAAGAQPIEDDARRQAEGELQAGIALTRRGQFGQAISHFLAARGRVADSFALEFNLALCYVGTRQFPRAIEVLGQLGGGKRPADVQNLLAQAYVGDHQPGPAWKALEAAAALTPRDERLYLLVSEACFDEGLYELGLQVLEIGLANLPDSAKLHFERGLFHSQLEETGLANREFGLAQTLAPHSEIADIAAAQQAFLAGRIEEVIRAARAGIRAGHTHYLLLTMLGEALLRAGATPGSNEFQEAQRVLEQASAERPGYPSAHIALGRLYLALGRVEDAIAQLEAGRQLDPRNKAVYPPLAAAYRRAGEGGKAREALAALVELNREEAARIGSAEGGHAGYTGGRRPPRENTPPH